MRVAEALIPQSVDAIEVTTPSGLRGAVTGLGRPGELRLDVYEEGGDLFFEDLSDRVIQDDVFSRMLTFPNVVITGHQAYFTQGALEAIARETIENISAFERGETPPGLITAELMRK